LSSRPSAADPASERLHQELEGFSPIPFVGSFLSFAIASDRCSLGSARGFVTAMARANAPPDVPWPHSLSYESNGQGRAAPSKKTVTAAGQYRSPPFDVGASSVGSCLSRARSADTGRSAASIRFPAPSSRADGGGPPASGHALAANRPSANAL